jgi:2,4-diaminopentanoate dehydrogenase
VGPDPRRAAGNERGDSEVSYRIIQWATGAIGKTCLRQIIDHPDLDLVGLYVHSLRKVGQDAGDIARRPKTGVIATNSEDDIVALQADCVLYIPLNAGDVKSHDKTIQRLLRSGKNVITTVAHIYPKAIGEKYAEGFEAACREGGTTLFGTGINPGFITERIAVAMTGTCTQVDDVTVTEVYNLAEVQSVPFIFDLVGAGKPLKFFTDGGTPLHAVFEHIFGEVIGYTGVALQTKYDKIVADHEFGVAQKDVQFAAGKVAAGGVVNFRWRWRGMVGEKPFFTIQMLWIGDRTMPGWDKNDGWEIDIRGAPGIHMRIDLVEPEGLKDRSKAMQYCVAGPVIRAIPTVCKAPPGILVLPSFAPYTPRM